MHRLARYTISGVCRTLDLQGRSNREEYGFLALGTLLSVCPTILVWPYGGFWMWPLVAVNAVMLLACLSAGVRRLRDAGQHVGWAVAHGVSLMVSVAYGLFLWDFEAPQFETQPNLGGMIVFLVILVVTVVIVAVLQALMLLPVAIFVVTTLVMIHLLRQPSRSPDLPRISFFGWLPWKR